MKLNKKNQARAEKALDAVYEHTDFHTEPPEEMGTYIGDILANLMHLCDREGIEFDRCLEMAHIHHEEEREEND